MLDWLGARARGAERPDPLVARAVALLGRAPGARVTALARELAIGERHLRRRFDAAVGYGPRRLGRVLRLQRALALAPARSGLAWVDVAYRAGYADLTTWTLAGEFDIGTAPAVGTRGHEMWTRAGAPGGSASALTGIWRTDHEDPATTGSGHATSGADSTATEGRFHGDLHC